jgi:hypothetical protein
VGAVPPRGNNQTVYALKAGAHCAFPRYTNLAATHARSVLQRSSCSRTSCKQSSQTELLQQQRFLPPSQSAILFTPAPAGASVRLRFICTEQTKKTNRRTCVATCTDIRQASKKCTEPCVVGSPRSSHAHARVARVGCTDIWTDDRRRLGAPNHRTHAPHETPFVSARACEIAGFRETPVSRTKSSCYVLTYTPGSESRLPPNLAAIMENVVIPIADLEHFVDPAFSWGEGAGHGCSSARRAAVRYDTNLACSPVDRSVLIVRARARARRSTVFASKVAARRVVAVAVRHLRNDRDAFLPPCAELAAHSC